MAGKVGRPRKNQSVKDNLIDHVITQEDLDNNPSLVGIVEVGETIGVLADDPMVAKAEKAEKKAKKQATEVLDPQVEAAYLVGTDWELTGKKIVAISPNGHTPTQWLVCIEDGTTVHIDKKNG